jgi:hypothetical protein
MGSLFLGEIWIAEKIPDAIRKQVLQRPDVLGRLSGLDDKRLDDVLAFVKRG